MSNRTKMLGGVFIFRGIAAADVAAGETQPEVDPSVAHFQAFLAAVGVRLHAVSLVEVRAFLHALSLPQLSIIV